MMSMSLTLPLTLCLCLLVARTQVPVKSPASGSVYRNSESQLQTLETMLQSTHISFVLCVRPTRPGVAVEDVPFDGAFVHKQLACAGAYETAMLLKVRWLVLWTSDVLLWVLTRCDERACVVLSHRAASLSSRARACSWTATCCCIRRGDPGRSRIQRCCCSSWRLRCAALKTVCLVATPVGAVPLPPTPSSQTTMWTSRMRGCDR